MIHLCIVIIVYAYLTPQEYKPNETCACHTAHLLVAIYVTEIRWRWTIQEMGFVLPRLLGETEAKRKGLHDTSSLPEWHFERGVTSSHHKFVKEE